MHPDDSKPPNKNGVGASSVALPPGPWATVLDFLTQHFATIPREEWLARMSRGEVFSNLGAVDASTLYQPHTKVHYYRHLPLESRIPFSEVVLFQDEHLVVADKPHFLPVMPAGRYLQETLLVRLKRSLGIDTLVPVHRIDRDTAGLVLFSVQPRTRNSYVALFRERAVSKRYEAIAPWRANLQLPMIYRSRLEPGASFMQMRTAEGTPNSETRVELLERRNLLARYNLYPLTGKKHQLRAHMAALEIPIVNDRLYPHLIPFTSGNTETDYSQPLQLLARSLTFVDPLSGQQRQFDSLQRLLWDGNP